MGGGRLDDADPLHAGSDARPALRVDDALVEALGDDEQLAGELGHRAVAGGLRRDAQAVPVGETDGLDHVLGGLGGQHRDGAHRDGHVPGRDEGVVRRIPRQGDRACGAGVQFDEGGVGRGRVGQCGKESHDSSGS